MLYSRRIVVIMATDRYDGLLPQCEGPKLHPFARSTATLEFKRLLSDPNSEGQAHVFEASIGSTGYAIKVVCKHSSSLATRHLAEFY